MRQEIRLTVKPKFINDYKSGFPLLTKEAISNWKDVNSEGTVVKLVDNNHKFIAKGYYGKQNKGYGWVLSRNDNESFDQSFFQRKISAAIEHRKRYYNNPDTTAFRVFNGEGDGIGGVTIEYFDGYYLIHWYNKGIYQFKDEIIQSLQTIADYKAIYQKKRFATDGKYIDEDDFVTGKKGQFPIFVKENGVQFAIYLNEGAMVGVFLDQREVRKAIREKYAKGKTVLNTFSYTGAFSVFAALGGAKKTTSVDLANRSLSKTIEQFSINKIDYEAQDIIVEDVFHYFKYAGKKNLTFDMVILDPPSFARSKKHTFSAAKDYTDLLKETIAITADDGIIVASTNCSSFGMKKFKSMIEKAFKEVNGRFKYIEEYSLPSDFKTIKSFPEGNYLKVVFIQKIKG
ncbi:class I SAM-dependent rRNA methyltransferase [Alkalihalobacillus sp. BA299]|uniref:class I SAM-dependent rRNA methyltransferase n=1 Tax=Alkalihalobacillus sp. BA299 TaxID=2815938 RepID=UPI001ADB6845|nr:class I SAM-dependent rRNA methyltransferase [Alkalihalobacillus sp. BA299]